LQHGGTAVCKTAAKVRTGVFIEVANANQSRVRVTAPTGWAVKGRATDSSPASSLSGPIRHRAQSGSQRVRIEARDESDEKGKKQQQQQRQKQKRHE
jgi:hypothetical protein